MNAATSNYDDNHFEYRSKQKVTKGNTAPSASRRSTANAKRRAKAPVQFNGMHRRRRKKINW